MNIKELFSSFKKEDFFQNVNLHIHSTHSDGERSFDELVNQAKKLNLKCFSITDHNSVLGYKDKDLSEIPNLIKGVEFDCFYKMTLLHILGYNIDINNKERGYIWNFVIIISGDIISFFVFKTRITSGYPKSHSVYTDKLNICIRKNSVSTAIIDCRGITALRKRIYILD